MKLKNMPILLIPLLLLSTLAACDGTSGNSASNETVDNIVVKAIDGAVVGEVIDLAEMVTIEGGNQVFDCELLTEDTASIDGKKVTILSEGVVDILITSGDKERSVAFNAYSKEKYAYNKYTNSINDEFFIGVVDNSSTGTYLTSDGWLFGENFTVYSNKALNNSGYGYEGQFFQGTSVYTFSMDDALGENFKFGPGVVSGLYYSKSSFTMSTNLFTTGENGILEGGADAAEAMLSMLGYRSDLFEYYMQLLTEFYQGNNNDVNFEFQTKGVSAMMYDMENTSGEIVSSFPVYNLYCTYTETVSGQSGVFTWGTYYLRSEKEYVKESNLYKTISKELENTPEGAVPEKFDQRLTSIANSKNYTMTVKSGWYDSTDLNKAKPIETPNLTLDGGITIFEEIRSGHMAETEEKTYVNNEDVLHTKNVKINNENKTAYDHFTKADNKITKVTNYTVSRNEYTIVNPTSTQIDGTTLWDKAHGLVDYLADDNLDTKATRNVIYSEEYEKDEDADYNYVFNGAGGGFSYLLSILSMSYYTGATWGGLNNYGSRDDAGNIYSGFEALNLNAFVYMTDDTTTINFKFGWTANEVYHIVIEFSNVGTTVIPAL